VRHRSASSGCPCRERGQSPQTHYAPVAAGLRRQPRAHRLPALRPGIRTRPAATVPGLRHPGRDGSPPARGRLLVGSRCSPAVVFEVEPLAWAVVDPCGQTLDGEGTGAGGPRAAGWVAARASAASIPASGSPVTCISSESGTGHHAPKSRRYRRAANGPGDWAGQPECAESGGGPDARFLFTILLRGGSRTRAAAGPRAGARGHGGAGRPVIASEDRAAERPASGLAGCAVPGDRQPQGSRSTRAAAAAGYAVRPA
jgi:hypothetical protein